MKINRIEMNVSPFRYIFTAEEKEVADFFMTVAMTHADTRNGKPIFEIKYISESEE